MCLQTNDIVYYVQIWRHADNADRGTGCQRVHGYLDLGIFTGRIRVVMKSWKSEEEARNKIKELVAEYYHDFKENKKDFDPGDRISYASRVFDEKEMCSLTDATLDFWLTTGRFSDQFEKDFAEWIGVKYAHLVNSGSSANLIAFQVLTALSLESAESDGETR